MFCNNVKYHLVAVASECVSGIDNRWWMEKLIAVRLSEGCCSGPAFGDAQGVVARLSDYDSVLREFLKKVQDEPNELIADKDEMKNYSLFRSFRKTAQGRAREAGLGPDVQSAMNRWTLKESARGRRPRWPMIEHYSAAHDMMPVTWRYYYVQ